MCRLTCDSVSVLTLFGSNTSVTVTLSFPAGVATASSTLAVQSTTAVLAGESCTLTLSQATVRGGASVDLDHNTMALSVTNFAANPYGVFSFDPASMAAVPAVLAPGSSFSLTIVRSQSRAEMVWIRVGVDGDTGSQLQCTPGNRIVNFTANQATASISCTVLRPATPQPLHIVTLTLAVAATVIQDSGSTLGASVQSGVWVGRLDAYGATGGVVSVGTATVAGALGQVALIPVVRVGGVSGVVNVTYVVAGASGLVTTFAPNIGSIILQDQQATGTISITIGSSTTPSLQQSVSFALYLVHNPSKL